MILSSPHHINSVGSFPTLRRSFFSSRRRSESSFIFLAWDDSAFSPLKTFLFPHTFSGAPADFTWVFFFFLIFFFFSEASPIFPLRPPFLHVRCRDPSTFVDAHA